jgi:hypothetical protein
MKKELIGGTIGFLVGLGLMLAATGIVRLGWLLPYLLPTIVVLLCTAMGFALGKAWKVD